MKRVILEVADDVYDKVLSFLSLLPEEKIRIIKKKENKYKKYYGILKIKNSEKEIDQEIKKMREEWDERLSI